MIFFWIWDVISNAKFSSKVIKFQIVKTGGIANQEYTHKILQLCWRNVKGFHFKVIGVFQKYLFNFTQKYIKPFLLGGGGPYSSTQ